MLRQHSAPGLALAIYDILLHWRNQEELHPIQSLIWNLQAAMDSQDLLVWDNFCFGLVSKNITAIQQYFWGDWGYRSYGEVWMSKLVRNIWEIQKIMLYHRNSYFHASNGTIHQHKE